MRLRDGLLLAAAIVALGLGGCDSGWWLGPLGRKPAAMGAKREDDSWLTLDMVNVSASEPHGHRQLRLTVMLPAPRHSGGERHLSLRFAEPLDGARVDVTGLGPNQSQTLLEGKRFPGKSIDVALGAMPLDQIRVTIHRHLRQPPILRDVRLGERPPWRALGRPPQVHLAWTASARGA